MDAFWLEAHLGGLARQEWEQWAESFELPSRYQLAPPCCSNQLLRLEQAASEEVVTPVTPFSA